MTAYLFADAEDTRSWLTDGAREHRAAPDVARAVVLQRLLWDYGADLRKVTNRE